MIEPDTDATLWDLDWSKTDEELAQLIGRDPEVVAEFRRRVLSGGDGRRGKWMKPPPEVIELWREEARNHTVSELMRMWRLTLPGVLGRLKRHHLTAAPSRRRGPRKGHKRIATTEAVEQWRRDAARHTAEELAQLWGVTIGAVRTRLWRHGIAPRSARGPSPAALARWRQEARGRTIAELAVLWGVPYGTAWGRARRFGLPVKRREPRVRSRTRARPRRDVEQMRRDAEGRTVKELA
ncbi:MAG TPA: hypothetical protein VF158_07980, partial [Longimicrobiales bacterium]